MHTEGYMEDVAAIFNTHPVFFFTPRKQLTTVKNCCTRLKIDNMQKPLFSNSHELAFSSPALYTSLNGITFICGKASQTCQIREWERKNVSILSATRTRQGRNNSRANGKVTDKWNGSLVQHVFLTLKREIIKEFFPEVSKWVCELLRVQFFSCSWSSKVLQAEHIWLVRTDMMRAEEGAQGGRSSRTLLLSQLQLIPLAAEKVETPC